MSSAAKNATVSAAFGRSRSASTTRPSACTSREGRLGAGGRQRRLGRGRAPARAAPRSPPRAPARERRVGGGEALGRAEHEPLVAEIEGAPAPPRRERHLPDHAAPARPPPARHPRSLATSSCETARWRHRPPERARASASSTPSAGTSPTTRSVGSVSVPVLSVQTTSTDASDSTAFSCCASTPRWATLNADTAAVRLIRRIRPSGTRFTMPAVRSCTRCAALSTRVKDRDRRAPIVSGSEQRRAGRAVAGRWPARAGSAGGGTRARSRSTGPRGSPAPTAVASNSAAPSTANEPDHTGSPGPRTMGSDSPVRLASSSASPSADTTVPSATT